MEPESKKYGVTIDDVMDFLKEKMVTKEDLDERLKTELGGLKHELMDYTDRSLAKLRGDIQGDIVTQSRKEDGKLTSLIEILHERKVLSDQETKALLQMEPFPRSMV